MKRLLVTIGIPTYSRLALLEEAVASALRQTYTDIEVLISDDGPLGPIAEWSRQQCSRDPRVRYRRNPERRGLAGNWNAIGDDARGERVVIIGDDDRLMPDFVSRLMAPTDADVVFCDHHVIDSTGERLPELTRSWSHRYGRAGLSPGLVHAGAIVWSNGVPMSGSLIRTDLVRRLRFKEDLNSPDVEFFARLAAEGGRFWFEPDLLMEYRVHPGSETSRGLTLDRLVHYLEPIPAPPGAEEHKEKLLGVLIVGAVGRLLRSGARSEAAALVRSRFYPRAGGVRTAIQRASTSLPWLGPAFYRLVAHLRSI